MNKPRTPRGRDGRQATGADEWSALGLSTDEQALLARHRADGPAPTAPVEAAVLWARIQEERAWQPPVAQVPRTRELLQLGWWQLMAQPGRLVAPLLTALLLIAGELFTTLVPRRPIGLDLWAVMAPWLGFWALGRGDAAVAGVLDAWTRIAPLSAGRARTARWVGAAVTGAGALAIALAYGGLTDGAQVGLWAATAGVGFSASLALGLTISALLPPRLLNATLAALGVANLLAVLAAASAGRPDWVPVLALFRVPLAVYAPLGLAALGLGLWRVRRGQAA